MVMFLLILFSIARSVSHTITSVDAPRWADPRRAAALRCHYTQQFLDPPLHSVKWYRDTHEIFRYTPQEYKTQAFNNTEISVENSSCDARSCMILVRPERGMAKYTCEVSSEGPRFAVDRQSTNMTLAILPEYDPLISRLPTMVQSGEEALVNCTSDYSLPAATIEWFVDDVPQEDPALVSGIYVSAADGDGLRASWRSLRVSASDAERGHLSLRCQATVPTRPPLVRSMAVRLHVARRPSLSKFTSNSSRAPLHRLQWYTMMWTLLVLLKIKVPFIDRKLHMEL